MVDGADAETWSAVAVGWSRWWSSFARPAQDRLITEAAIGPGVDVVDVGCGSGEFLAVLARVGARAIGVDPAAGMRRIAAATGAEVVAGDAEHLPLDSASVDVVVAVNALQFAADTTAALAEMTRVLRPGGRIAVANWAEAARNDLDTLEAAVARADDPDENDLEPADATNGEPLRAPGGLERAFAAAGLEVTASGIVDVPWRAADDDALVAGVLLGADEAFVAEMRPVVIAAAQPFRDGPGDGYVLKNAFRWAVGIPAR